MLVCLWVMHAYAIDRLLRLKRFFLQIDDIYELVDESCIYYGACFSMPFELTYTHGKSCKK